MAKLRAHGYEVMRISTEKTIDPTAHSFIGDTDMGLTLTVWERTTRSYRSDGHILEKLDVKFRQDSASALYGGSDFHSYGWKLYKKLKKGATVTPQEHAHGVAENLRTKVTRWVIEFAIQGV